MVRLVHAFQSIVPIRSLIVGDFMLDTYTNGSVDRISPEAPVPILKVKDHLSKAGGAGNVVLNMLALGSVVYAMGRIGQDAEGKTLLSFLQKNHANTDYLFIEKGYDTPVKHRFIADNQQLIRVDRETVTNLSESLEEEILTKISKIVSQVDVIAISDYGKGFLSNRLLSALIQEGKKAHIPVIVDPKGLDFSKYREATVIKPNLKEAYGASKLAFSRPLPEVARVLKEVVQTDYLVITRSSEGISLFTKDLKETHFPVASVKEVKDVTGAGDTVLATLTLALANHLSIEESLELSNLAAGIAVERFGCAHVSFSDLATRLLEMDFQNKIFDESHLFVLKQALNGKKFTCLALEKEEGISPTLFRHLKKLSKNRTQCLICMIKDPDPGQDYLELLSSLQEVDFILLHNGNMGHFFSKMVPEKAYEIKDKKLIAWKDPKDLLKSLIACSSSDKRANIGKS